MARITREKFKTFGAVFDNFTIRNLFELSSRDFFEEGTLSPISVGKESNVFSAHRQDQRVVVKIHRLETSDFNRMYFYIKGDPRFQGLQRQRRKIIFAWTQREYRNLLLAREAGCNVPMPIAFKDNILVMSQVGKVSPAPKLKDSLPENRQKFFDSIVDNIRKLHKAGYTHGDLSAFNILNDNSTPYLIDLSSMIPKQAPAFNDLLERDVRNICLFFSKHGLKADFG
ncbi:serine protein kinase RIO, partial [Candidatus Woesearchaeota archaeon]|nr:serine protein kinase RIO [Candidatus Woesearchaeota archaeon]